MVTRSNPYSYFIYMKISQIIVLISQLVKVNKMRAVGDFKSGGGLDSRQLAASPELVIYFSGLRKSADGGVCGDERGRETGGGGIKRERVWVGDGI